MNFCSYFCTITERITPIMLLVLVLFLQLEICLAAKLWRYYPATGSAHGYITTKTKFILEFTGSDEWQSSSWFSEKHCQVENKGSPITAVVCTTSGYHPFAILDHAANKLDVENIFVIKTPYCYEWQITLLKHPVNTTARNVNLEFQLWIRKRDEMMQNSTNGFPSEMSKHMTKLFHQVGQRPSLSALVSHSNDDIHFVHEEIEYSTNKSVWEVTLTVPTLQLLKIKVDESTVGFLDCFVQAAVFEIQSKDWGVAAAMNITKFSSDKQNDELTLIQNDCAPNVVILAREIHLLFTDDYFDVVSTLVVPQDLLTANPSGYKPVFTRQGNLIVHTGKETFIADRNSSQVILAQGLPMDHLRFSSYPWCHQDNLPYEELSDTVVAWSNQTSVYLSLNATSGFISANVPSYFEDQGFRLLDIKVNGICHCVFYLIESSTCPECNGTKTLGYTTQDYKARTWDKVVKVLEEEQHLNQASNWTFQFLPPNSLSMLIWNAQDMFYKSSEEEATVVITRKGNSQDSGGIVQLTTSNNGEYLVFYEDSSLYYGRIGMNYMIELNSSFPQDAQIRFLFDLVGNAYVVSLNSSSSSVARKNLALDNEIFNALYPDIYCPFIQFSVGKLSSGNVLDRWKQFQIWGYLVYQRKYQNDIQLIWNPTNDLPLTIAERKHYYRDVTVLNKTFIFKERKAENSTFASSSSFSVTLLPKLNAMTCKRPFHKVFHFHTGCPPTRQVFIRDSRSSYKTFSEEKEDFSLTLSSGENFHPALFMYDGNVLIKKAYSSFNVFELHKRTDFDVRVKQESTGDITVVSFDGSGLYRFSLSFADKNISFCETVLEFDVSVKEGHFTNYFYVEFACVTLITISFLIFLAFNYFFYRKEFMQRHEEDNEAKDRLQELQYLAQLQYYRAEKSNSTGTQPSIASPADDTSRRAAMVTGKTDRRGHRRSSVFERVSKGAFQDINVKGRAQSLQVPQGEPEVSNRFAPRRNTTAQ